MALTECGTHTFADMKLVVKRVFGDKTERKAGTISVSQDVLYYTDHGREQSQAQSSQARGPLPGTNTLDKFGRRTKSGICQSTYHWVKDCTHKKEHVKVTSENQCSEKPDEGNITLFYKEPDYEILMVEALGLAVMYTAWTVWGEKWLDNYVQGLDESEIQQVISSDMEQLYTVIPCDISVLWSATKEHLADCLTKKGASSLLLLKALKDGK